MPPTTPGQTPLFPRGGRIRRRRTAGGRRPGRGGVAAPDCRSGRLVFLQAQPAAPYALPSGAARPVRQETPRVTASPAVTPVVNRNRARQPSLADGYTARH